MNTNSSDEGPREEFSLLGESIPVRTHGDQSTAKKAYERLANRVSKVQKEASGASRLQVALLAGLNLAGDLIRFETDPEHSPVSEETRQRIQSLQSELRDCLNKTK
ncbi:MAG: cell division protein ZapA [bacterium]